MVDSLREHLKPFGLSSHGLVDLSSDPTPESIRYLDLFRHADGPRELPDAIVEVQKEPIACVVSGDRWPATNLPALRRKVAMRGDIPYLVVSEPGRLTVYGVDLDNKSQHRLEGKSFSDRDSGASSVFYRLHLDPWEQKGRKFVHEVLFDLLTDAIDGLQEVNVGRDDAISLAGRALFIRFLVDRDILKSADAGLVCPKAVSEEELFRDATFTMATCEWLDRTFNGDFLPLSLSARGRKGYSSINDEGFRHLSNILCKSPRGQLQFDWGDLDFAHIPIGVLSQVYERQAERWDAAGQKAQSVYYTPWRIAEYMVREVFAGLKEQGPVAPHQARVLDPSVGGAVFLVAAFQEIVASWWDHHGSAPDTVQIRSILYEQLTGFDISEPALRFAALGLYLKAIELDPDPQPVEKLGFEPLRGKVLHNMRTPEDSQEARFVLGSLGSLAENRHYGAYDVVIGNPPWTALDGDDGRTVHADMVGAIRPVAIQRLGEERAKTFTVPDLVPDLPFVWRSLEWAREGGWIALALHARLLFKTSQTGRDARAELFEALTVTGVLNGTALRNTEVWPEVTAPFCLLFAVNKPPPPDNCFYFVSPYLEQSLNRQGRLRVDALAAQPISVSRLADFPNLLKSLFRGSGLDTEILENISQRRWPSIVEFWESKNLVHGQGYQIASQARDASFLLGKPNLTTKANVRFLVDTTTLQKFEKLSLHRPRSPELYIAPLLLVRKSPPADRRRGRALVSFEDLAFNESFYGFSTNNHPQESLLVRYLFLIVHSQIFLWHLLMTSGEFGIERESIQKDDVETLPIPPLTSLERKNREKIEPVFNALISEASSAFQDLDTWAAEIYGLDRCDQVTIHDTLEVHLPFPASRQRAQTPPTAAETNVFANHLQVGLAPFVDDRLRVQAVPKTDGVPWQLLLVDSTAENSETIPDLGQVFHLADKQGASQIIAPLGEGRLLIAILRQYRYWTPTRARLCGLDILHEHLNHLEAGA